MHLLLCLINTLAIFSAFLLMSDTKRKGGWVRRFKFIYLWALLLCPLAHILEETYICWVLRTLIVFGAFIILCHIPCRQLSRFKQSCAVILYCGLFLQTLSLILAQLMHLMA